jgi:hypothetical protein
MSMSSPARTIELPAEINPGLCDTACVRLLRGVSTDEINAMIDDGRLLFVFDISAKLRRKGQATVRLLRFASVEIFTPQFTMRMTIEDVINRMLPISRAFFWGREIAQLLLISRPTLQRIARQLGAIIRRGTFQVSRKALAAWLRARWIGGQTA